MKLRASVLILATSAFAFVIGLLGVNAALFESERLQRQIVEEVCTGTTQGIFLAKTIYPTNHAHFNEEVSSALSAALQFAPEQILESFGTDVCLPPDHLPKSCVYQNWKVTTLQALAQVTRPDLAEVVSSCRFLIEKS